MGKVNRTNLATELITELEKIKTNSTEITSLSKLAIAHIGESSHVFWIGEAEGVNKLAVSTAAISAYYEGLGVTIKVATSSTAAASLKVNALAEVPILNSNSKAVTNLKAGGVYTLRYVDGNFILQGEGGEYGTANAAQVLTGYTVGKETGLVAGSMVNQGSVGTKTLASKGASYTIPAGYHNGGGKVEAVYDSASVFTSTPAVVKTLNEKLNASDFAGSHSRSIYTFSNACKAIAFTTVSTTSGSGLSTRAWFNYNLPNPVYAGSISAAVVLKCLATNVEHLLSVHQSSMTGYSGDQSFYAFTIVAGANNTALVVRATGSVVLSNINLSQGFEIILTISSSTQDYSPTASASAVCNVSIYV